MALDRALLQAGVLLLISLAVAPACETTPTPSENTEALAPLPDPDPPASPVLRRLTRSQYVNAIHDLFGEEVAVPSGLEPDGTAHGLIAAGSAVTSVSPLGTERYANAAAAIIEQVLEETELREALLAPCADPAQMEGGCPAALAEHWGPLIWRRPLQQSDLDRLAALGDEAAEVMGTVDAGATSVLTALLQSPFFLYRIETGEESEEGGARRHTGTEMASRLAFFLWDGPPDAELLAAGASGELLTDEGLNGQVERLLEHPRSRRAVRSLFADWLELHTLDGLTKDPTIFKHYSPDLGQSAREETLLLAE
ncbi:MAG: DUF1592 domain-containing protein, partial [Myxococcota bacterium]|nr:DUF1592 domain-containing protein [Myxococcota bacterium]